MKNLNTFISTLIFAGLTSFNMPNAYAADPERIIACKLQELQLTKNRVELGFYQSAESGQRSIIIVPPTGGENFLDRSYAENLCEGGFDVYVLQHWNNDVDASTDLGVHQRFYDSAQSAIDETLARIKSPFVGILGTSVGAIHAAAAISLQPRIRAGYIIVGGAPVAEVIATSDQDVLVKARKARFELFKFKDDTEYIAALEKEIRTDPFKLPPNFRGKTLGMVISSGDTKVNYQTQEKLKELWQPQTLLEMKNGHFFAIIKTWLFHKMDIVHFFQDAASKPNPG